MKYELSYRMLQNSELSQNRSQYCSEWEFYIKGQLLSKFPTEKCGSSIGNGPLSPAQAVSHMYVKLNLKLKEIFELNISTLKIIQW